MLMNGEKGFFHPVTGAWVAPFAWYEGYAHQEHEQQPAEDEKPTSKRTTRKQEAADGE